MTKWHVVLVYYAERFFFFVDMIGGKIMEENKLKDDAVTSKSNFKYRRTDSGIKIEKYIGLSASVIIPSHIDNLPVTIIGEEAFKDFKWLKEIQIPNSVTSIGDEAFFDCISLTSIQIPNFITSIGEGTFLGCESLKEIQIPNSVTSIGLGAFWGCKSLKEIQIPNSVEEIGYNAFKDCKSLTLVRLLNPNTIIREDAFIGCSNSLRILREDDTSTEISKKIPQNTVSSQDSSEKIEDFKYRRTGSGIIIEEYISWDISAIIPSHIDNLPVTSIGDEAFKFRISLKSIQIPNSVTYICKGAFEGCTSLTSIQIPNSVIHICEGAFSDCISLTSIQIPNSVVSIGDRAFYHCNSLTSIQIPNSVITIGEEAFKACKLLKEIQIPNSVISIGDKAFQDCESLTLVRILNPITTIGREAFEDCSPSLRILREPNKKPVVESHKKASEVKNSVANTGCIVPSVIFVYGMYWITKSIGNFLFG